MREEQKVKQPIAINAFKLIQKLPHMNVEQIANMRNNAIGIIVDEAKKEHLQEAQKMLNAIDIEFIRRYGGVPNNKGFFIWPDTATGQTSSARLNEIGWVQDGVLSHFGYRVGTTEGKSAKHRETILSVVFDGIIPPIFERDYLQEWNHPKTAERLQKIAETIASLARNAKRRRDAKLEVAIKEWEADLEYLYWKYYVDHFRFAWPITSTNH